MVVSMDQIKALREETSAGIMDCKRALEESNGDIEAAKVWLQKKGLASAAKKGDREAKQGLIFQFVHEGTIGVLVEVNCETDFVARTDQFVTLGEDIARHIAETGPQYVRPEDIPAEKRASEDSIHGGQDAEVDIKLALLSQPYVGDNKLTVGEMVQSAIGKLGENIVVRRFTRYELEDGEPGLISQYVHSGRIGALLQLDTDSPEHVRTQVLADLARTVGQHIVGAGPKYIEAADMPADEREREREVHDGNDAEVDKELVLLAQPTLRDPKITVGRLISQAAESLGGRITVRRFVRYELGESLGGERPAEALAE